MPTAAINVYFPESDYIRFLKNKQDISRRVREHAKKVVQEYE